MYYKCIEKLFSTEILIKPNKKYIQYPLILFKFFVSDFLVIKWWIIDSKNKWRCRRMYERENMEYRVRNCITEDFKYYNRIK